jgi:CDP-glycerol glycerophosphotransferase
MPIKKLLRKAKMFAPTRIAGALRRRAGQYLRKLQYRPGAKPLNTNAVLFESFQGKNIGDNPLDIYYELIKRRPDLEFIWTTSPTTEAPAGARGVRFGSKEWLDAIATSKYLVNNSNFPWYFRKVPGQVYLQTWHGTPLKRLGRDIPDYQMTKSYIDTMDREALAWDYLIAPNQFCVDVFPSAFNYKGRFILTGYPRNDRLSTTSPAGRQAIREKLGVTDPNLKLVMYAPTWRDFKRTATGKWDTVNFLDKNIQLPEGFQLLFRGHHNTHAAHTDAVAGNAIDVTKYPDVTDLYLAADVLVTDYSSVMFDYTVTGKPILFLAPDLERYRSERGFYFDYEAEVPGPILNTDAQLLTALENLDALTAEYAPKYRAWQAKFDHAEDGQAAKRVVDIVWGEAK